MAGSGILVVVKVVIPDQFFAGGDVAEGEDPDAALDLVYLAIGFAGVIQVGAQAMTVNDGFSVFQAVKVGAGGALVEPIRLFGRDAHSAVLNDASTLANGRCRVDTDRVNRRRSND